MADDSTNYTGDAYSSDPYLDYRPHFARSLPVQILLTGIVLTLASVLFIHLLFTAQYHWPLAPINYVLQMSGVTTLLISLIATLHVVLSSTMAESQKWPYMLNYIAVNVPPADYEDAPEAVSHGWNTAQRATWLIMNATTSGLIQITHIHFLTLLFPSRLEARLIIYLLGPLALTAAVVQILPIAQNNEVSFIASSIKNVCNATLSLLFTAALFLWGLVVNRKQAWRTDGGTAAFGAAALSLAIAGTALTFMYVPRQEEYLWLPSLMWAVILWQSFLGWWWWVGAGSGASRGEELLKREERKENQRREARARRKSTRAKAKSVLRGVAGALTARPGDRNIASRRSLHSTSQEQAAQRSDTGSDSGGEGVIPSPRRHRHPGADEFSITSDTSVATLPSFLPSAIHRWYASLRHEHVTAARRQAEERVQRIRELERGGEAAPRRRNSGWGLGSFALRLGDPRPPPRRTHSPRNSDNEGEPESWSSRGALPRRSASTPPEQIEAVEMHRFSVDGRVEPNSPPQEDSRPRSFFWWGPLGKWRLQDSTTY